LLRSIFPLGILLFGTLGAFPAVSEEALCDQIASYTMNVRLDPEKHLISGTEYLSWTNTSEKEAGELWFHLYWNAFQNNQSTFFQERARDGIPPPDFSIDDWGYCRIGSIRLVSHETKQEFDLTPFLEFRQPDDANVFDQTVAAVELPESLEPGESITLKIDFSARVPRPVSRTGVYRETYFIAQWFPKIGVYQNGNWNCHQYHAYSEYFADYGTYDVRITLPSSYVAGATGKRLEKKANSDGTTTHRFIQHSVHDFAWTASPYYLEFTEEFEFAPGKRTEITLLLQPYHRRLKDRYINAVKHAVRQASVRYGSYPYATITCVDPAYNSRSGGMEYPAFFTGGAHFLDRPGTGRPEGVTIHEFGHGYFYALVGSNEFENAWLDEGLTSFLDSEIYYAAYGEPFLFRRYFGIPVLFKDVTIPIELEDSSLISQWRRTWNMDRIQRYSWKFMNKESYVTNAYFKPELMLRTLQRYMGKEAFAAMIKEYSETWWFKHPRPEDFYAAVSRHAGEDMSWFLDQFIYKSEKLDYAVGSIRNAPRQALSGWLDGVFRQREPGLPEDPIYESEVTVRRLGGVRIPVEIQIFFEDGRETTITWDGQYRWKRYAFSGPAKIEKVLVDPDFKLVLDTNRTNNSRTLKAPKLAPLKWTSNWMLWLQHALEFLNLFGG